MLPLLTFPYLVRVLGVEKFGLLGFVAATIGYFTILVNFGFQLSATRQISIVKNDKVKVMEIFSTVMSVKIILILLSLLLLTLMVFSFDIFRQYWFLYYFAFLSIIGTTMFPLWFFQGMEKMKYITYIDIVSKLFYTVSIFLFVHQADDYYLVPLLQSTFIVISGVIALYLIYTKFGIRYTIPTFSSMLFQVKESWHIFIGHIAVSLYTVSTTFILGIFTNNIIVGYYVAAQRLIFAIKGLMQPLLDAFYPHFARQIQQSKKSGFLQAKKLAMFVAALTFSVSSILFIFAEPIVLLILGENYTKSIIIFKILAFLPFIIGVSNVFGVLTMLNFGYKKEFSRVLLMGGLISLVISFILVPKFQDVGSAVSVLLTEIFVLGGFYYYWHKIKGELI